MILYAPSLYNVVQSQDFKNSSDTLKQIIPDIPAPTGKYKVGTSVFHITDSSRQDFVLKEKNTFAEIMFQIWYPAKKTKGKTAPYITDPRTIQEMLKQKFEGQTPALLKSLGLIETDSYCDAPIVKDKLPILFISPGLGAPRFYMTTFAQELASHGYFVINIDHPYCFTVLPDGRIQTLDQVKEYDDSDAANAKLATKRAIDASYILNCLSNPKDKILGNFYSQLNLSQVGILGHSMGGAVALEATRLDKRFKAAIDLDGIPYGGVIEEGFYVPTAIFASAMKYSDEEIAKRGRTREWYEARGNQRKQVWAPLFEKAKADKYWVKIQGTTIVISVILLS